MKHRRSCHRRLDLFVAKSPPAPITPAERTKLLPLVSALLSEAPAQPQRRRPAMKITADHLARCAYI
ncbi:hypothetical protein X747_31830 [Mesorhizobium sp. LNJC384A00]|uniref:hypothetical protein n=1 Tax=Mesorhizobium sp. LNJC384A00 TaxID=1287268 RepID=UPI0003CEE568|nr:hypothetical protein [Mesorhizobium sp. LNJC384A00]ESY31002.1 hypothetical protein X747_31830 [Mesorhizobium sp. LNJC384A00]